MEVEHGIKGVKDGRKTCGTAATREALVATPTPASILFVTAETDNTGYVVIGGSTVVAALATRRGTPLGAGDSVVLAIADVADVYLDSTVSGDGVTFAYSQSGKQLT